MKNLFFLLSFLSFSSLLAQTPPIVVVNAAGTTTGIYYKLTDAIKNATAGSFLYLSGGIYTNNSTEIIDKELHLIGAGYDPESTIATSPTVISNQITFTVTAKGSTLEGLNLNYVVLNDNLEGIIFRRVYLKSVSYGNYLKNLGFYECILLTYVGQNYSLPENISLKNCVLISGLSCTKSTIENCLLLNIYGYFDKSTYKSNIFRFTTPSTTTFSNGSFFYNNIFDATVIYNSSEYEVGTQDKIVLSSIFSFLPASGQYTFSFKDDFHPSAASEEIVKKGYNGTHCGIYGGTLPFKDGGIPSNPHIYFKSIEGQTDASGNLKVQVKVKAQSN